MRFQSTHPRGVRPLFGLQKPVYAVFQSTHPRGVRREQYFRLGSSGVFQSTHPRGVRLQANWARSHSMGVSIHAPAWGATYRFWMDSCHYLGFQSTHPRGVRRSRPCSHWTGAEVSIHAPAWGATQAAVRGWQEVNMFQSTHPRGVRRQHGVRFDGLPGFNPRTRVGCDAVLAGNVCREGMFQSTHPRGVRPMWVCLWMFCPSSFNPRTRVGCDKAKQGEEDTQASFNPRTRVGCDAHVLRQLGGLFTVSIHAPAWGATHAVAASPADGRQFQSTHPRGVRPSPVFAAWPASRRFNPRTRVGCDTCAPLVSLPR